MTIISVPSLYSELCTRLQFLKQNLPANDKLNERPRFCFLSGKSVITSLTKTRSCETSLPESVALDHFVARMGLIVNAKRSKGDRYHPLVCFLLNYCKLKFRTSDNSPLSSPDVIPGVEMFCQALRCCRVPLRCIQNTSIHCQALYSFTNDLHHRNSVKSQSEPANSSSYSTQISEELPSNGQLSDKESESAILKSDSEKCNETERTSLQPTSKTSKKRPIAPDPDTCCESGCVNCVWIEYANEVRRFYPPEERQKILKEILDNVEDFNVKMFLKMELGL